VQTFEWVKKNCHSLLKVRTEFTRYGSSPAHPLLPPMLPSSQPSIHIFLFLIKLISFTYYQPLGEEQRATEDPISGSLPKQEACKKYRGREKNSHFGGQHLPSHVKRSRRWILMD
jgi:hypothetical protein